MYSLYKYKGDNEFNSVTKHKDTMEVMIFYPKLYRLSPKRLDLKEWIYNVYLYVLTKGNYYIYYVEDEENVIHTSYCTGKSMKFPFMDENDLQIGPCITDENHRGKGIYPRVVRKIVEDHSVKNEINIYMIIRDKNIPSIAGVNKAGFIKYCKLSKSNILKRYSIKKIYDSNSKQG